MPLRQPNPLGLPLVEAEVAPRPGPPLVVAGQPDPGVLQNPHHAVPIYPVLNERESTLDVGLGGDVSLPVRLVGADSHVGNRRCVPDPCLDRLDLHVLGAPAHLRRRQRAAEHLEPVVEAALGVQARNRLAE